MDWSTRPVYDTLLLGSFLGFDRLIILSDHRFPSTANILRVGGCWTYSAVSTTLRAVKLFSKNRKQLTDIGREAARSSDMFRIAFVKAQEMAPYMRCMLEAPGLHLGVVCVAFLGTPAMG